MQDVIVTHSFDAPRKLVFKAMTDPELIPQWWGPREYITTIDKLKLRKGGVWRFIQRNAAGNVYGFNGVYHTVDAPKRLVYTFEFEGMPGHVLLATVTLEASSGQTKVTEQSVFQSVQDRDGMVQTGMEKGSVESHDRMTEVLQKIGARV
jgi:uncharacterized protein YndB with AHSA1/START domain